MLRTLKHGQNRTSCVFDKRYAEQQCRRNSRQRRKFAPPGASQKKGAISEFPTKGYPPNLRVVVRACMFAYLFISSKLSRSSAPALHCSPRSPTRADPPGVSAEVLASRGVTAPGRLAPVPSPLTQTPLTQPQLLAELHPHSPVPRQYLPLGHWRCCSVTELVVALLFLLPHLRFAFLVAARLSVLAPVRPEPLVAYVLQLPFPRRVSAWSRCACCCCCCSRCCCRCLRVNLS